MFSTGKIKAIHDKKFDGIYIGISIKDFNKLGYEFGDSVDLYFSNGFIVKARDRKYTDIIVGGVGYSMELKLMGKAHVLRDQY